MGTTSNIQPLKYRTLWLSDIHLGFRGCKAEFLLDFLRSVECKTLYLVGDIIDVWSMRRGIYWPQPHNDVIRTLLGLAKQGTEVIFIPGNHDEIFRDYRGLRFGNLRILDRAIHITADGRRFLVLHGDEFDSVVRCSKLLALAGSKAYDWLLQANRLVNWGRRKFGFPYWSLAAFLKHRVKNAVNYISNFETAVATEARRHGVDGLVCGHIHRPEISMIADVLYMNCGDWVESCSALVETFGGAIELLHWSDRQQAMKSEMDQKEAAA